MTAGLQADQAAKLSHIADLKVHNSAVQEQLEAQTQQTASAEEARTAAQDENSRLEAAMAGA